MRIGTVQMHNAAVDKERNTARVIEFVRQGVELGLDLICFPELASTGYPVARPEESVLDALAEPADGATSQRIAEVLAGTELVAGYGFVERGADKPFNSYAFVDASGVRHVYRKSHMSKCGDHHESELFEPGDDLTPFELHGASCGAVICWDGFFPETARVLALRGAEVIVWALAGLGGGHATQTTAPVRAMDNAVFVVVAAMGGTLCEFRFDGGAGIFDRNGKPLAKAEKDAQELVWADVDPAAPKAAHHGRRLSERRPELYGVLADRELPRE